ncbi:ubiquinol-cytochrome C chaperone [Hyphomicrobium denitrificans 1NES1]|uniref:Ubiquinol-cytochrome C chaperone n=1 Tax=Hyphomicrobium denitrificans 1NES1 TaxID=670307 RepID=N0B263_9HYPH|nr:ubiquinol-cytochrome C chaperone family protein [Hyphomicrobium denitrificans]AGK57569.1 ubiquinol-cytochrome C chaperone [Hyphomicrobium denitrificans 1NES1]
MLQWFRRRTQAARRAEELYGSVVTAARHPAFYRDMGAPDTPEGRFEMIALHLFLLLEGIRLQATAETELAQHTIEAFVTDMDDCMREMGVGDMAVAKKVKRAAAAFYERAAVYRTGLAARGTDLEDGLLKYVFAGAAGRKGAPAHDGAARLARYMRAAADLSSKEPFDKLVARGDLGRLLNSSGAEVSS